MGAAQDHRDRVVPERRSDDDSPRAATRGLFACAALSAPALAALSDEPGAEWPADMLARVTSAVMPVPTYLELGMVLESRFGLVATGAAARFVRDAEIKIADVTAGAAERALEGWRRFGEGRHPAKPNFGDCLVHSAGRRARLAGPVRR